MKKILLLAVVALGAVAAQAQDEKAVLTSKFFDNFSIGLKGGGVSPMKGHGFWSNERGIVGLEIRKQVTPVLGLGVEGEWTINTSSWTPRHSSNVFDHSYVGGFAALNLMNAFGGYKGAPRTFELEAVVGAGWIHAYYPSNQFWDGNAFGSKAGLNFNFNLGESKAWTLSIKPAVLWNLSAKPEITVCGFEPSYDINHAYVELEAGVTYHFKNSNGTRSFKIVRPMDEELLASLNAQVNDLRNQLNACENTNAQLRAENSRLNDELTACKNRKLPECPEAKVQDAFYVFFPFNSANIPALQKADIETIANAMADSNATATIEGFASKEGNEAYNKGLSQRRADAVKAALVKAGVDADRINATGEGVSEIYSQLGYNRFVRCIVNK